MRTATAKSARQTELFAWQGFAFETPLDYAPSVLSGTREEGYVRLSGAGNIGFQVRWKSAKDPSDLKPKLRAYLDRLARDAKKAKAQFKSDSERDGDAVVYRYTGVGQGRGRIFHSPVCSRVFFVEVVGARKDSLLPAYRNMTSSFRSVPKGEPETWSVLGLSFQLPEQTVVEKRIFMTGCARLILRNRKARVEAGRWSFGHELIEKHGLEQWAKAALHAEGEAADADDSRVQFSKPGMLRSIHTLVKFDEDINEIATLQVATRNPKWRPDWDWFV